MHEHRQHRCVRTRGQPRRAISPRGIHDASVGALHVRHLARREHDEDVSAPQPLQRALETGHVVSAALCEGVDGHDVRAHLGDAAQQLIAQHLHVGTHAPHEARDRQAVERAVRMIRDDEQRARSRDAVELGRATNGDVQRGKRLVGEAIGVESVLRGVQTLQRRQARDLVHGSRKEPWRGGREEIGAGKR